MQAYSDLKRAARDKRKRPQPRFRIGQTVRTLYYTPGAMGGIPSESAVTVLDVSPSSKVCGTWEEARYKVAWNGGPGLWLYESTLAPMAGAQEGSE